MSTATLKEKNANILTALINKVDKTKSSISGLISTNALMRLYGYVIIRINLQMPNGSCLVVVKR